MTARFLALYGTPSDPAEFDRHYREVHIPLGHRLPGLRRYSIGRDIAALRGGEQYYMVAELEWSTMEELRAAFASPEGRATAADAAHLQQLAPVRSMIFTLDEVLSGPAALPGAARRRGRSWTLLPVSSSTPLPRRSASFCPYRRPA